MKEQWETHTKQMAVSSTKEMTCRWIRQGCIISLVQARLGQNPVSYIVVRRLLFARRSRLVRAFLAVASLVGYFRGLRLTDVAAWLRHAAGAPPPACVELPPAVDACRSPAPPTRPPVRPCSSLRFHCLLAAFHWPHSAF